MKDLQPTHVAVAFDRKEPTFRKEMFIAYQAQRPEMDEELGDQFDRAREILAAMEVPIYDKAGFEADDVLGTIVERMVPTNPKSEIRNPKQIQNSKSEIRNRTHPTSTKLRGSSQEGNNEIVILTGDKDLMQLVDDKVKLYLPIKGVSEAQLFGSAEVKEKLGVPPELVVDYKGLVGDPSDNYPGVKGIGPVTAVALLSAFGSFSGIYEALEGMQREGSNSKSEIRNSKQIRNSKLEIRKDRRSQKSEVRSQNSEEIENIDTLKLRNLETSKLMTDAIKKKLLEGREAGELSKDLAKIRKDVEVDFDLDDCEAVVKQPGRLARVLEEYGFQSLVKQLGLDERVGGEQMRLV